MTEQVTFRLNGQPVTIDVEVDERLVTSLRERTKLTGTKTGCGIGECGACSVLLDGRVVLSCLTLTVQVEGREVTTVEGLAADSVKKHRTPKPGALPLSDLQQAFIKAGAVQCGYCTPGMLIAAESLLRQHPRPTVRQIRAELAGNLCRCTGYTKIVAAIRLASKTRASRTRRKP